jgi:hypothetical protein
MAVFSGPEIPNTGLVLHLDAANPRSFSPNTFPKGNDIYDWYVSTRGNNSGNSCTVDRDLLTSKSPANGIPLKMSVTGNDAHIGSYNEAKWNISTAANGQTWRVSVYAKSSVTLNNCELYLFGANSLGNAAIAGGGWYGISAKTITVTPEWQRFDHFITFSNAEVAFIQIRLDGPNANGAGTTIWWDGLQVELASNISIYNPKYNQNRVNWASLYPQANTALFANPTFGNTFLTFDGVNNYSDFFAGTLGSVITVEMFVKLKSTNALMPFGFTSYNVFGGNGELGFNTGNSDRYGLTPTQTTNLGIFNNWKHLCFKMVNTTSINTNPYTNNKIYVNGVNQALTQTAGIQHPSARTFTTGLGRISGWMNSTQYRMSMDLGFFKIYNRELSNEEISQNFEATRSRYGI